MMPVPKQKSVEIDLGMWPVQFPAYRGLSLSTELNVFENSLPITV